MAEQGVWTDCKLYLAGYDLSGDMNAIGLNYEAEAKDVTRFGDTTRKRLGGLKMITAQHEGLWQAGTSPDLVDGIVFSRVGTADVPVSISPGSGTEGDVAYLFRALHSEYVPSGQIGEVFRFSVRAEASQGPLVRGNILANVSAATASSVSDGQNLGAVDYTGSSQQLYASLHVLSASAADTLDVVVQSDTDDNWSSPVGRITFAQATGITSEWKALTETDVTDTWWRVSYTIAGTDPSFSFVVTIGIQ